MPGRTFLPRPHTVLPAVAGGEIAAGETHVGKVHFLQRSADVGAQVIFIRVGRIAQIHVGKPGILIPQFHVPAENITVDVAQDALKINFNMVHHKLLTIN